MVEYKVGQFCKRYRESIGKTQKDAARDMHRSIESVSAFENGRSRNYLILLWYVRQGMDTSNIDVSIYE